MAFTAMVPSALLLFCLGLHLLDVSQCQLLKVTLPNLHPNFLF